MSESLRRLDPPAAPGGSPRISVRLLLAATAVFVTLLTVEVGARIYAFATNKVRGMTYDAELGWRPLPHISKQGGVWGATRPASTNSQGWRDREHPFAKPAGVRRVVAIGDSFTFGTEVNDGERFTDLLQQPEHGLDVVNLGVAGYGPDQELRVLETEAFRYEPDVILLTSCVKNDLEDLAYERLYSWPKPTYVLADGVLQLRRPRRTWDIALRTHSYVVETLFQKFWNEDLRPVTVSGSSSGSIDPLFNTIVGRMAAAAHEHHASLVAVLAYVPDAGDPAADRTAAVMKKAFDVAGVPWLDTRDLLRRRSATPDQSFYAPGGTHWNAAGHVIVAEAIRELITSKPAR